MCLKDGVKKNNKGTFKHIATFILDCIPEKQTLKWHTFCYLLSK